jgi:hypothetical protein
VKNPGFLPANRGEILCPKRPELCQDRGINPLIWLFQSFKYAYLLVSSTGCCARRKTQHPEQEISKFQIHLFGCFKYGVLRKTQSYALRMRALCKMHSSLMHKCIALHIAQHPVLDAIHRQLPQAPHGRTCVLREFHACNSPKQEDSAHISGCCSCTPIALQVQSDDQKCHRCPRIQFFVQRTKF